MNWVAQLFGVRIGCSHCGKSFKPNLRDVTLPGGGALRVFECPHCATQYNVARFTPKGVDLMRQLQATKATDHERIARLRRDLKKEVFRA